jgi:protein-disulfide isomerase
MNDEMEKPVTPITAVDSSESKPGFLDGNPRTMFTFGLVSGMAMILLMNNFVGIGGGTALAAGSGTVAAAPAVVADPVKTAPAAGPLAPATKDDHVRGDLSKAKVVMIEYSDFQCPYCGKHDPTMQQIVKDYGDQVAWVYRHFPLSFHPNAEPTALASECASEQGKFWEFADAMFAGQTANLQGDAATTTAFVTKTAQDLKLDMTKFNSCVASAKYQSVVDADQKSGSTAGVNGTPATYINGTLVSGAVPYASMKKIIDDAIAKAK